MATKKYHDALSACPKCGYVVYERGVYQDTDTAEIDPFEESNPCKCDEWEKTMQEARADKTMPADMLAALEVKYQVHLTARNAPCEETELEEAMLRQSEDYLRDY